MGDTGKWFKTNYSETPASSMTALTDWRKLQHRTLWHYNRFYRVNILERCVGWRRKDGGGDCISAGGWVREYIFWIRDLFEFNEGYPERYLRDACKTKSCVFDNLPLCDGARWGAGAIRAGIYPVIVNVDGEFLFIKVYTGNGDFRKWL